MERTSAAQIAWAFSAAARFLRSLGGYLAEYGLHWVVALVLPFVLSVFIQAPLEFREVSRFVSHHLPPYTFLVLLAVLSFSPSVFTIARVGILAGKQDQHLLLSILFMIMYSPLMVIEYFYVQCALFKNCYLL